jgi:hypothetical protein
VSDFRLPREWAGRADNDLLDAVTERLEEAIPSPFDRKEQLFAATPDQRAVFALSWLDAEVNNGGFHQFFFNPTGALAAEALGGARLLGLDQHAAIIEDAFSEFPNGAVPEDFDERLAAHEDLSDEAAERIALCDERWYALAGDDGEALYRAQAAYIRAHPTEFLRE